MSDTSKQGVLGVTGSFIGLTAITVALRFYARRKANLPCLTDDWLMIPAFVAFVGAAVCVFLLVDLKAIGYSSFGFTKQEIIDRYAESTKLQISLNVTTMLSLACTKVSALFFYRRIFCTMSPNMRVFNAVTIGMIVVVACWLVTFEILNGLQCHGHFDTWNPTEYAKYCTISWNFLFGYTVSDFLLDVLVIALPIPVVLKLHTTLTKKLSIIGIFMLACVALGASCARMVVFVQVFDLGVAKYDHADSERILTRIIFYSILESGISIVAINLPSLLPVFRQASLENIAKHARSATSLASRSSDQSVKNGSRNASRSDSGSGAIQMEALAKRSSNEAEVDKHPQPKLAIYRQNSVQIATVDEREAEPRGD